MNNELKIDPCPFCGGEGFVFNGERGGVLVGCYTTSNCGHGPNMDNSNEAIAAWNRRTPPAASGQQANYSELPNSSHPAPAQQESGWHSLSDVQWMDIVNHDHVYESFSKEGAVHEAVKRTEAKLREINEGRAPAPAALTMLQKIVEMQAKHYGDGIATHLALDTLCKEVSAILATASAAPAEQARDAVFLQPDDMKALKRFAECCEDSDSGGHDVSRERMFRLTEIGVMRSMGFGRHMITAFGGYVLGDLEYLPLKTYDEYAADSKAQHEAKLAAIASQQKGGV